MLTKTISIETPNQSILKTVRLFNNTAKILGSEYKCLNMQYYY